MAVSIPTEAPSIRHARRVQFLRVLRGFSRLFVDDAEERAEHRHPDDPNLRTMALYYDPKLPLNVSAATFLIEKALRRTQKDFRLRELDDRIETTAHAEAVRLATRRAIIG